MGITRIPDKKDVPKPDIVISKSEYATPVVDTRKTSYNSLSTFGSGSKWAVDFYLQLIAKDTSPNAFDSSRPVIYGQCRLVKGFELLVTSQIEPRQSDSGDRHFEVIGTANVYSVITPNVGDVFVADVGDGRNGVFTVTQSTRNSTYAESMTTIEFRQISFLTVNQETQLNRFVVEKLFFDREMMRNGVYPLIKEKDIDVLRRLTKAYRRLTNLYVHEFFDTTFQTLMVPGQERATYDPYMARFVSRVLDRNICPQLAKVNLLTTENHPAGRVLTMLNAIERVDGDLLYSVATKSGVVGISTFESRVQLMDVYTSGVKQVVVVTGSGYMKDLEDVVVTPIAELIKADIKKPVIDDVLPDLDGGLDVPVREIPYIKRVVVDNYYIFSEAFYKDTAGKSVLETLVHQRINREPFDTEKLADIADVADELNNLERFYYIPIIIAMIKMVPGVL